jgi:DNA polymerase III alpha subunit (gram-positive type)
MFYHNTTTEPTVMPETGFFYNQYCFGVFCIGFSIFFTEIVLKYIKITDSYDDDKVEEEVEEEEIYTDKYIDEFNLLNERILTDLDYLNLKKNSICETTPGGIVLLNYNKETDGFCYYTDNLKEITYDILETVARKFVIEYNCKQLYIKPQSDEPTSADAGSEPTSADAGSEPTSADAGSEPNTNESKKQVFAKFKKYNTGGKGSVSKIKNLKPITEQVNRFRYKGKIYEYEINKKKNNDTIVPSTTIDYATYKKNFLDDNKNM